MRADRIAFYSNRYIVGASGHVEVDLADGAHLSGDRFAMDLRLNRFVLAGDVHLKVGAEDYPGAAFSEFFDFRRAYFIPITSEPDRWTYTEGDYAHPLLGREMPGDAFFLPDLAGERVFLYAKRAVIAPRRSIRFAPARINFGLTFVTFPTYFLNFSPDPNFAQNSLSGASVDGPYDFAGGDHGLATLHLRYDPVNKLYFAYEQHQVSENHYLVASINPLTRPLKQYNLLGYDRISPDMSGSIFLQESAFQHAFSQPLSATALAQTQFTVGLPHSFLQLATTSYYDSLLAQPLFRPPFGYYYGDPSHNWVPDHPTQASLTWTGSRERIGRLPLSIALRSSYGMAHNGITPLQTLHVPYYTLWYKALGVDLSTDSIRILRDPTGRRRDVYFVGSFDKQRQWFSSPHHVDTTIETLSLTKLIDPAKLSVLLSYTNENIGDFYGAQQDLAYPPNPAPVLDPFTGQIFPGFKDFRGFATTRSFNEQLNYSPNTAFTLVFSMRENRDFPAPIAGPIELVNGVRTFYNYGLPPYQATADLRFRLNGHLVLDVSRAYYFGFGGYQRWQPNFSIQVQQ